MGEILPGCAGYYLCGGQLRQATPVRLWFCLRLYTARLGQHYHVSLRSHLHQMPCRVVARNELDQILQHQDVAQPLPLLVMANKQDLEGALPASELAQALQLDNIRDRPWQIVATNAITGDGLDTGTEWLADALNSR